MKTVPYFIAALNAMLAVFALGGAQIMQEHGHDVPLLFLISVTSWMIVALATINALGWLTLGMLLRGAMTNSST